jgi:hypothetical protein
MSRDGYFFEGLNISISTFCVCADGFQVLSIAFHYIPYTIINFFLITSQSRDFQGPPPTCPHNASARIKNITCGAV